MRSIRRLSEAACLGWLVVAGTHHDAQPLAAEGGPAADERRFAAQRHAMVEGQLRARDIRDPAVLAAMDKIPRHRFVPEQVRDLAYEDAPVPIGFGQTISQPYIVAYMSQALRLTRADSVLEIGTGSGYQAAVLSELAREVYTIEILPQLAERARATLSELGCRNVHVRTGDGYLGWPELQPFDRIMVTAAPEQVPPPLVAQLALNGRMVLPVGRQFETQKLIILTRTSSGVVQQDALDVRFVPLVRKPQ
jgi:protein-L-isoaspartate(D-aspartate) O-methyltransferase